MQQKRLLIVSLVGDLMGIIKHGKITRQPCSCRQPCTDNVLSNTFSYLLDLRVKMANNPITDWPKASMSTKETIQQFVYTSNTFHSHLNWVFMFLWFNFVLIPFLCIILRSITIIFYWAYHIVSLKHTTNPGKKRKSG